MKPIIRDLQSLLRSTLGDQLILENYVIKDLIGPGENFASKIVSLNVVIKPNKQGKSEDLYLVAKLPPPTAKQRHLFNSPETFRKEIFMYSKLLPFYKKLEIENGIKAEEVLNLAPKYYGSRLGLNPDNHFDDDAVILIENLKPKGYYCVDRRYGCDLTHAKLTVETLARFHALGMATKEKNPEFFEILKVECKYVQHVNPEKWIPVVMERVKDIAEDPAIREHFEACVESLEKGKYESRLVTPKEPWSTIIHADFWANNIMYRRDDEGKLDDIKFIDFQNYRHFSPMEELVFFITCGVDHDTIEHVDELIDLYYDTVIERLKLLNCNIEPYSRETFDERVHDDAGIKFAYCLSMIKIMTVDVDPNDPDSQNVKKLVQFGESNENYRRRLRDLVLIYNRKGWLGEYSL